ncbi:MAG TPA: alpha/beta hydrolase [Anaerolineaceae bacterium]|nr:alpha/beta hydrolase [Anaerolineaceae bacterium]
MDCCTISTAKLCYLLTGAPSKPFVVIEQMLAGCSAEWWHLAERWSRDYRILVYDRAGYGESSPSSTARSPAHIAKELYELLDALGLKSPAILIGHSMGGLYVQQFARLYPQRVRGLILLDPVSAKNYTFRQRMSKQEYSRSGFDKSASYRLGLLFTQLGLSFLLKPLLKKALPFNYFQGLSSEAEGYVLKHLTQARTYRTALAEYAYIDPDRRLDDLEEPAGFPAVPLRLVCHAPEIVSAEIEKYGRVDQATAARLDQIWIELMKEYLAFSPQASYAQSTKSGHHFHLSDPEIIEEAMSTF